ncbi:helix-turn-helix transcriptional regulator [Methylobacterium nodulans]|uniref:Transcriptional regulator, LuxR family n=1 Tax=Methylobacterium nodulans (strain LMG 21967 / CNCM I-2342 / ORS 2060) TaxID=460265 RepID=B8ICU3_METNO|nr:helix-turn-helix transcriptional regulator [Methylobacterium nodulans]ACL57504.1 transcriptional regulator, LuxR family [Methylobacterium nodulans ORS 2060]
MIAGEALLLVLQRFGYCAFLITKTGLVIAGNAVAALLLKREVAQGEEIYRFRSNEGDALLRQLLGVSIKPDAIPKKPWVIQSGTRRLLCSLEQPAGMREESSYVLLLVDLEERLQPKAATLQQLFSLTNAESKLALQLARGGTLEECAEENGTSVNTARVQLRSIFAKTGTARQSDLVAFLNRIAMLG